MCGGTVIIPMEDKSKMEAYEVREIDVNSPDAVPEKRCYTVEELQIILEISRPTVYNLIRQKQFRAFQVAGGKWRVSKKSFDEWLDARC